MNFTKTATPLSIAVIGAGPGGLAFARAAQLQGHKVTVFERYPELTTRGGSIGLTQGAQCLRKYLGMGDALQGFGQQLNTFRVSVVDGEHYEIPLQDTIRVKRKDLVKLMAASLEQDTVVFGKHLKSVSPSTSHDNDGPVICTFADGSVSTHDLVVGTDGIHSAVRACAFDAAPKQFTNYRIMMMLKEQAAGAPSQRPEPSDTMSVIIAPGTAGYVMSMPVKGPDGRCTDNIGVIFQTDEEATDAWDNVAATEHMKEKLAPFIGETNHYLYDLLESADIVWDWGVYQHTPMSSWTALEGRVVLLGDACHATAPFMGQGANMAIQDAVCLARFLSELPPQKATVAYEARRKASCEAIVAGSTRQADMWIETANAPDRDVRVKATLAHQRNRVPGEPLV